MTEDKASIIDKERVESMERQVKEMKDLVALLMADKKASAKTETTTPEAIFQKLMSSDQTEICKIQSIPMSRWKQLIDRRSGTYLWIGPSHFRRQRR